jgi:peptidase E
MAADGQRHILAIGGIGGGLAQRDDLPALIAHALDLSGVPGAPRVCVLNTANGDDPAAYLRQYWLLSRYGARVSHLQLFPMPNADPEQALLSADVIFVGGGSVANMLAVWRVHGVDDIMRRAWVSGVVLAGVSAGAICWFDGGTTDSFGPELRPFSAGLGLLPGSYCPHYSSEPRRRPAFQSLVADGTLAAGIACDDGAAAHYVGQDLAEIVADEPGPTGYLVEPDGSGGAAERALSPRVLATGP